MAVPLSGGGVKGPALKKKKKIRNLMFYFVAVLSKKDQEAIKLFGGGPSIVQRKNMINLDV